AGTLPPPRRARHQHPAERVGVDAVLITPVLALPVGVEPDRRAVVVDPEQLVYRWDGAHRQLPSEDPARTAGGEPYAGQACRRLQVVCRVLEGNCEVIQDMRAGSQDSGSPRPARGGA